MLSVETAILERRRFAVYHQFNQISRWQAWPQQVAAAAIQWPELHRGLQL